MSKAVDEAVKRTINSKKSNGNNTDIIKQTAESVKSKYSTRAQAVQNTIEKNKTTAAANIPQKAAAVYPQPTAVTAAGLVQNGINAVYDAKLRQLENTKNAAVATNAPNALLTIANADKQARALQQQREKDINNFNQKEIEARAAKTALKDYLVNKTGGVKTVDVSKTTGGSLSDKLTAGLTQKKGSNSVFENQAKRVETTPYNSLIDYDKTERAAQNSPEYAALESALFKTRAAANPVRGVADDVVGSISSIGAIPYVVGQAIVDGNVDTYNPAFRGVRRYNSSKEGLTDGKGGVANFAINTGLSMLESAARMPLAALGINVPVALAGLSAGANAAYDAAERGATPRQALATGTLQGAAEAGAEKISLGSLLENVKTGGSIIKNIAKQAGVEAGEELTTEGLNTVIDGMIMGEKSNYSVDVNNAYNDYISQGYTPEEALSKAENYANSNVIKNLLLSGLGGAISGGVFSGVGNIPNIPYSYNQYKANKAIKNAADNVNTTKSESSTNASTETKPNIKSEETVETKYEQTFGNSAQHLKNFTSGYSEKSKTNFVTGYNNEMDSADYAAVFNKIYGISKNSSEPKLDRTRLQEYLGTVKPNMSNENLINTATRAWFAGQNDRKVNNVSAVRGTGKVEYEGNVRLENVQHKALQTISRAIKVDVVVSDKIAENGYYDRKTGKIYISSNAQQPLRAVFNHEVTHAMQDYQPEAYRELKDYMVAAMNKHNATAWETAVNEIYTKYSEDNPDFTLDMAEDEVIAKTAENFIESPESLEQLANTNVSLARKFVNAFRSTLKKFVEAFKGGKQSIDTMTLEQWKTAESKWIDILYNMSEDNVDTATQEQLDQLIEISGGDKGSIEEYAKFKYLKNINQLTAAEVEESIKAFESDANKEWTRFVKEDYTEERAAEFENSEKYSLKTAEEMQKDNQKLSEEVEYLKRQFKTTSKTVEHTMKDIRKTVSAMLNEKSSTADKDHISERIYNLYKDIKENSNGVNDTTFNSDAFKEAQLIAYEIINSAKTVDEHTELMKSEYKSALDELKNYTFKVSEADMNAQDFKDLKSVLFPYIKLSRTDGTSIDSVWSEIYDNLGYLIGSDYANADNVADQLDGIANLVSEYRRIKNNTVNPYESGIADMGFEDAVHYTTMELLEGYFIQPKTYADKSNERLKNLREFYKDKLTEQKERLQASYESRETKRKNNEQRSKYIKSITKIYNNLSQKLISNTDKKHIPEELKGSVSALLQLIDVTPKARNIENPSAIITKFRKIAGQLNELAERNNWIVDEDLGENISELENIIIGENGETRQIKSLNNEELEIVHQVVAAVNKAVSDRDKTFRNNKAQTISAAANNLVKELGDKETEITDGHILYAAQREFLGALNANTVFETMLGDTAAEFYTTIKEDFFRTTVPRLKYVQDYWTDNLKDWSDSEQHEKVIIQGHSMTKGQAMAIYMTSLRKAAQRHLKQGGIVITKDYTRNGILKPTSKETKDFTINDSFIEDIRNMLTDKDLRICDCVAELMRICSGWGNEATMIMYDYEKFNEENYFPMNVDTRRKGSKGGSIDFKENPHARLKNVGMTKALVKNANAPLMISDIIDMATQHAITMAYYSGLAPSLTDFERLYNAYAIEQVDKDIYQTKAVKKAIIGSKGANMQRYVMQWLDDINGGATKFDRSLTENVFGNYKGAMVSLNAKVILLQATSVYRALSQTDIKYIGKNGFIGIGAKTYKKMSADMIKHCGRAMWKDMGFSQININKGASKTVSNRGVNTLEKIQDLQAALPNWGDRVAWTALWYGARNKIADTHPDIEIDSEQYYELVNDEFGRIIDRTQVMDSPFSKSPHLRSKNAITKTLTMFTSEPSMMFNMLVRSYGEGKKEFCKTVGSIVATVITAALCTSLIKLGRKPADDKDTPEKLGYSFVAEIGKSIGSDVISIVTASPITKLIAEVAEFGYNVATHNNALQNLGQSYFEPIEDFVKAAVEVFDINSKKSFANRLGRFGLATGTILGVGAANFFRDVPRAIGRTAIAAARQQGYDTFNIDYSTAKLYYNLKSDSGLQELVRIAAKADLANSEYADDIKQNIIEETGIKKDILSKKIKSAQTTIINNAADDFYEKYGDELLENASTYRKNGQLYVRAVSYSYGKEGEEAKRYRKQIAETYNVTEDEIDEALKKIIQKALREDDMYD